MTYCTWMNRQADSPNMNFGVSCDLNRAVERSHFQVKATQPVIVLHLSAA